MNNTVRTLVVNPNPTGIQPKPVRQIFEQHFSKEISVVGSITEAVDHLSMVGRPLPDLLVIQVAALLHLPSSLFSLGMLAVHLEIPHILLLSRHQGIEKDVALHFTKRTKQKLYVYYWIHFIDKSDKVWYWNWNEVARTISVELSVA